MTDTPQTWSRKAEIAISLDRMSGDKTAKAPTFWPGRPSLYRGENPITADGEVWDTHLDAMQIVADAQTDLHEALRSSHEFTDRDLQDAQTKLRAAIAKIETVRQRIVGAGEVLEALEAQS